MDVPPMSLKDGFPAVAQSSHPLILHKITQMRKVCHANKSDWWFLWLNGSVYKWERWRAHQSAVWQARDVLGWECAVISSHHCGKGAKAPSSLHRHLGVVGEQPAQVLEPTHEGGLDLLMLRSDSRPSIDSLHGANFGRGGKGRTTQ